MSAQRKTTVGVLFGGRSVEHDVSVVTGHQVMQAFDPERYEVVPIFIDRDGRWYTGEPLLNLKNYKNDIAAQAGVQTAILSPSTQHHGLIVNPTPSGFFAKSKVMRLDVVFPAIHGSHGEDGTLQGLFELADIPYVGCGVMASAIANDKLMTKIVLRQSGVPVVDSIAFTRREWYDDPDGVLKRITERLPFPMFVKPVTLGSSIGISKVDGERLLRASIDVAANLDKRVMVEAAVLDAVEINCALMGGGQDTRASVLEQPVTWDAFLTYEEKYMRGSEGMKSAARIIPAPLDEELTDVIQKIAVRAFQAIEGSGTARIDFLVKLATGEVYLNEINTMPGSLAFYLWQDQGMTARDVVHKLVEIARETHAEKRRSTYNYQTSLIDLTASRGLKGTKGSKSAATTAQKDDARH
jgi:D-alanine-D-alanine ligase